MILIKDIDGTDNVGDLKLLKMNTECIYHRYMEGYLMWRYVIMVQFNFQVLMWYQETKEREIEKITQRGATQLDRQVRGLSSLEYS